MHSCRTHIHTYIQVIYNAHNVKHGWIWGAAAEPWPLSASFWPIACCARGCGPECKGEPMLSDSLAHTWTCSVEADPFTGNYSPFCSFLKQTVRDKKQKYGTIIGIVLIVRPKTAATQILQYWQLFSLFSSAGDEIHRPTTEQSARYL